MLVIHLFSYLKKLLISQQNIIFCNRLEHLWLKINKRHTGEKKKKKINKIKPSQHLDLSGYLRFQRKKNLNDFESS
jgi:uncharacterized membrane protein